ncbi:HEPN domain-containing protein [Stenotrophomonas sp. NY11291]|uniref:HEPN domain-containing protein n=1 Tax=Stenotrophomonas sp. NY11291 TaxID=2939415 RepID=UPI00200CD1BA|nr:HEPN domain-containing protein [Stenotrophomonas sp. NY11291]UQA24413.1 HEPN domain-containing protein [Stenotrophomonas sp. NY11291]
MTSTDKNEKTVDTKMLLNSALELIHECSPHDAVQSKKFTIDTKNNKGYCINDAISFYISLDSIYSGHKKISSRFSRATALKIIEKAIFDKKVAGGDFSDVGTMELLKVFTDAKPEDVKVIAPISGIRIDSEGPISIGPFELGLSSTLKLPIANDNGYYISSEIKDSYDNEKSISIAHDEFQEFINLIFFTAGRKDDSMFVKTGLPSYDSISHQQMYVETSSYQILKKNIDFPSTSIKNMIVEKVPLDNEFFAANKNFGALWDLYKNRKDGKKLSDFGSRILNCSISLGEALKTQTEKDSVIHTCIALEILLSYDEGSLFQKSIGDRLAETFVFIVAKDKESRIEMSKLLKKVYRMRSALVHGGNKEIDQSYATIIQYSRAAIAELLTSDKYKDIKKIDDLYDMVKAAQNSY